VWIGGAGATLGLVICILIFAKSQFLKKMGKAVAIPSLFNINEPVIFGLPIVLNPIMVIPFILIPIVLTIITYIATALGLVNATMDYTCSNWCILSHWWRLAGYHTRINQYCNFCRYLFPIL